MMRCKKFGISGLVAILALPSLPGSARAKNYNFVDLHPPGAWTANTVARGIDGLGLQVGFAHPPNLFDGINPGQCWSGTPASMKSLPGYIAHSPGMDVSQGQIVGFGANFSAYCHALLWPSAESNPVDLNPTGCNYSYGWGIHAGKQVGWAVPATGGNHAMLWSGTAASAVDLHPAGYDLSYACGVHGNQQVGYVRSVSNQLRAVLWTGSAASMQLLHPTGFADSWAEGTDGTYQVGGGRLAGGVEHALMWTGTAASCVDLHPAHLGMERSTSMAVANGIVVGYGSGPGTQGKNRAVVWYGTAGSAQDLHAFVAGNWDTSWAYDIDDQGNIVGAVYDSASHTYHAALWVPTGPVLRFVPLQHPTIQAAINASAAGDTVIVLPGMYNESITLNKAVTVSGLNPDDPWGVTINTIIRGDTAQPAVTIQCDSPGLATLQGVTITNGSEGVWVDYTRGLISKCLVHANYGSGILLDPNSGQTTVSFCWVVNNYSRGIQAGWNSNLTVEAALVAGNQGGGIYLDRCEWTNVIRDCMIVGNTCVTKGGGIYSADSSLAIRNCTIAHNSATQGGGMFFHSDSYPDTVTVTQSILWGNDASSGGGHAFALDGTTYASRDTFTVTYSDVQPWYYVGAGNWAWSVANSCFSYDPQFVKPSGSSWADRDYHIQRTSPCLNAGDPAFVPASGQTDSDGQPRVLYGLVDIGADEFLLRGDIDADGYVNVFDIFMVAEHWNTQRGDPGYDPSCDLDGDGFVNVFDIFVLAENWNTSIWD